MRIACQVVQYMIGATKRRFCIDNSLAPMKHPQKGTKIVLIRKGVQISRQTGFSLVIGSFEAGDAFAAEHSTNCLLHPRCDC
jgi:hypothetical protein